MFSRVRIQRLKNLSAKLRGGILKLRAIRRRLASSLLSKIHSKVQHAMTALGAWLLLKLVGAWAHVAEGFLGVFQSHKTAAAFLVVFALTLALAGSNVARVFVVISVVFAALLGIRYAP